MKKIFILVFLLVFTGCSSSDYYFLDNDEILEYPNYTTLAYQNISNESLLTQINNTYDNRTDIITINYNSSGIAQNMTVQDLFGNTTINLLYNSEGDLENVTYS